MKRSRPPKSVVTGSVSVTATPATPAVVPVVLPPEYAEAFELVTPTLLAMPPEQLLPINVDVPVACSTVGGVLEGLLAMRPKFAQLPDFELAMVDKLPVYMRAAFYAHGAYTHTVQPALVPPFAQDCATRFAVLEHATQSLIDAGLLDPKTLAPYGKEQGYRPLATDTMLLAEVLRKSWPTLVGHTALTPETLEGARHAASELVRAVGERDRTASSMSDAAKLRQRAFSLFARAYDEVRRGVLFLRWHQGDGDTLAPSIYAGRTGTHPKDPPAAPADKPATPADAVAPDATLAALGSPALEPGFASAMPKSPLASS